MDQVSCFRCLKLLNTNFLDLTTSFFSEGGGWASKDGDPKGPGQDLHPQGDQELSVLLVRGPEQFPRYSFASKFA